MRYGPRPNGMRPLRLLLAPLTAALALTGTASCATPGPRSEPPPPGLAGQDWSVETLTVGGRTLAGARGAGLGIAAATPEQAEGDLGCNRFTARVEYRGTATLTVRNSGPMTGLACEDLPFEEAFGKLLFSGPLTYEVQPGRAVLRTAAGDSATLAAKPRTPDAPLLATVWTVDSLVGKETASSLPAGAEGKARFTLNADGSASGNLGCNRFNAKATVQGDSVTFGPLTTTRMACLGPEGEVERALTELFGSGPLTWRIQDDTLTLTGAAGTALIAKAASAVE